MRPFNEVQLAIVQAEIDRNYSYNYPKLDVSEDKMRAIVVKALGIDPATVKSKANFMFYDCRTPEIGLEFKKRGFKNPANMLGKYVEFTMTRTIDGVPTNSVEDAVTYIAEAYSKSVTEFRNDCDGNVWFAGALHSDDTLVYYHEEVESLDASKLVGKWDTKTKTAPNLYVHCRETGRHVFTYLANGQKVQMKLRVPTKDKVHVIKAERKYRFQEVDSNTWAAAEAKGLNVETIIHKALQDAIGHDRVET